jgi:prolipoprotein diacylglyceryltransferase
VLGGLERFGIEVLRAKDDRFLGPFTLAQMMSLALILLGMWVLAYASRHPAPIPGPYLGLSESAHPSNH